MFSLLTAVTIIRTFFDDFADAIKTIGKESFTLLELMNTLNLSYDSVMARDMVDGHIESMRETFMEKWYAYVANLTRSPGAQDWDIFREYMARQYKVFYLDCYGKTYYSPTWTIFKDRLIRGEDKKQTALENQQTLMLMSGASGLDDPAERARIKDAADVQRRVLLGR